MSKKNILIGIMMGNINPEISYEMAKGISKYTSKHGIGTVLFMGIPLSKSLKKIDTEDIYLSSVYEYYNYINIDVLMVTYSSLLEVSKNQEFINRFKNVPIVLLQDDFDFKNNSTVIVNNKIGFTECLEHLILEHKYTKIAYVSGPTINYDAKVRLETFKKVMKKYNLEVKDSMIEYGDYSANIENQVRNLLKNNTKIEAIMFANDKMALSSYKVLESLGYKVGKDIAITGFDNLDESNLVHPSLTTVTQNFGNFGYEAAKVAVNMVKNKTKERIVLDTKLIKRSSCGCKLDHFKEIEYENLNEIVVSIVEKIEKKSKIGFDKDEVINYAYEIISKLENNNDLNEILKYMKEKTIYYLRKNINFNNIISELSSEILLGYAKITKDNDKIYDLIIKFQKWYYEYSTALILNENSKSQTNVMQSSYMLRKVLNTNSSLEDMIEKSFEVLKEIGIKSTYIYLLKNPTKSINITLWKYPNTIYLKAYYNELYEHIFSKNDKINELSKEKIEDISNKKTIMFSLSSRRNQYGFIIFEAGVDAIDSIQSVCSQINTFLYLKEIKLANDKSNKALEKSLKIIEAKNNILNNISMYDELTEVYNRRGLIESSMKLIKNNYNKEMQLLFCDLDHLKEINDTFGHKEGDYSIKKISETLRRNLPKSAIIGRLGGDEFIALYVNKNKYNYKLKIEEAFNRFNKNSKKNYYIETSIGKVNFISDENTKIIELINEADEYLYEAKKRRKDTIRKDI